MDYNKLNELKAKYGDYEEVFKSGDYDKAADILKVSGNRLARPTTPV